MPLTHIHRRQALEEELIREGLSEEERRGVLAELEKRESDYTRLQRQRMSSDDFEPLTIIGRGAFGEVRRGLCWFQCSITKELT
jgi:serine/threonine kinase 38